MIDYDAKTITPRLKRFITEGGCDAWMSYDDLLLDDGFPEFEDALTWAVDKACEEINEADGDYEQFTVLEPEILGP